MATQELTAPPPPADLPADHIIDFDYFHPDGIEEEGDVYAALKRLHDRPDILWTPRNGGHWIMTRSDDIRWVRDDVVLFSHEEFVIPRGSMNTLMPPVNVDPPYHARFRAVLNPAFSPAKIQKLSDTARRIARGLIADLYPRGHCEFVQDFAKIMPVDMFLGMLDIPNDRRAEFVRWANSYINSDDQAVRDAAAASVAGFLTSFLDEREKNPGDDMLSRIAAFRRNPRFQSEEEVIGMAMTVFIGGLDTVTNMVSFIARHLATHPEERARLIADPALIPQAAEEYLRRHALVATARVIKDDVVRKGITLRRDDMLLVIDALAGIDERVYADPLTIDFDRDTRVHETFGNGAHRCVGEHLARMEIIVFIEEWLKRIPAFGLDPALPPKTYGGVVIGVSQLGLRWDV